MYFVLSLPALLGLGWQYLGGGSEFEKVHPATYLLIAAFVMSVTIDKGFRFRVTSRITSDASLVLFCVAVIIAATYASVIQGASAAPFVDTFFAAILATIIVTCMTVKSLTFLRRLIDICFVVNASVIIFEVLFHKDIFATLLLGVARTPEVMSILGPREVVDLARPSAFFGNALDAGALFGVYSIANLVSLSVRFSSATIVRLFLSLLSYLAIFPTGSRAALVVTTIAVVLYLIYSLAVSGFMGYVNRAGLTFAVIGLILLLPISVVLWRLGLFNSMIERFQYDNGSTLSRDYALEMLTQASASELWFGRSVPDILAYQRIFELIAIEISWINFILIGGLITTIPLFVSYFLFLFRSMRLYCDTGIYFVSMLIFVVTATSNGIWSKTTVLTTSLIVGICFLRRDIRLGPERSRGVVSRKLRSPGLLPES
jgi:hypothetical protein